MRAIQVTTVGGPEVLVSRELAEPSCGPGQVRVRVAAAGVNFIDVYHRTGLYTQPLPFVPGVEAAGVVEAAGEPVGDLPRFVPGDRVAWAGPIGAYAEVAVVPAARLVRVPEGVGLPTAAASMLQGMTAQYLTRSTFPIQPGHTALVLAAAGGTGQLVTQMVKAAGGRVLAAVSSEAKATIAKECGADEVIRYDVDPLAARARALTDGRGVDVVYDGVGQATFRASLESLAPRGMLVLFGQSSGKVAPFDLGELNTHGSLYVTRPSLFHYIGTRAELDARATDVLDGVAAGRLRVRVHAEVPLPQAGDAHRILEERRTLGKVVLVP